MEKPDAKPSDNRGFHDWARSLVDDCLNRRLVWEGVWWENIAAYLGEFWVEWDIQTKRLREKIKKPDHRVRLPINLAQPAVRTELAKLTKNRPITDVLSRSNEERDLNAAEVGDKLLNNYAEREFHLPRVRRRMLQWVLMCGLGGLFVDWDPTLGDSLEFYRTEDGSPVLDPRVLQQYQEADNRARRRMGIRGPDVIPIGEITVREISPMAMGWDQSRIFIEDAAWCYISEVYDVEEVYRRWGVRPDSDPRAYPGVIEHRLLARFDLTSKLSIQGPKSQKLCVVHRLFVRPGHPWFPRGVEVVFTLSEFIGIQDFTFRHGELPLSVMGHIPLPISQFPLSVLQQLRGPVLEVSRTASQLIENRNLMANPIWRIPRQLQIKGETLQNRPGARVEYTHMPNVPPPEPVRMPEMPSYVRELIPTFKDFIQLISGQGETSQGQSPAGVRSGVQIQYLQEADDTRLGPTIQEFEETWERAALQILYGFAEKYTIPRSVVIYRRHSDNEVIDFINTMLDGIAGVKCQAGSAMPRSKAARQQFILDLWDRRLEQDPRKVRQMLELSEGDPDEWEIDLSQAARENRDMMRGLRPKVLEWYNHPAHHYEHRKWMKEEGFERLPQEIQEIAYQHDRLHTAFEQMQRMEAARMQMMLAGSPSGNPPPQQEQGSSSNGNGPESSEGQASEGPPEQFSETISPSSLIDAQPQ